MTASRGGNIRSRPMLKATRDEASTVAFNADIVESRPPNTMMSTPTLGIKFSAARTMPVSLYVPNISQTVFNAGSAGSST